MGGPRRHWWNAFRAWALSLASPRSSCSGSTKGNLPSASLRTTLILDTPSTPTPSPPPMARWCSSSSTTSAAAHLRGGQRGRVPLPQVTDRRRVGAACLFHAGHPACRGLVMSGGSGAGGLEVPAVGPEPRKEVMEGRGAG